MIRVGTSGWSYEHWRKLFYPESLSQREWLQFYSSNFDTVEINSTFYRLPFENMVKGWYRKTPEGFLFSVKGFRLITHKKRLRDVEEDVGRFMERVKQLEEKLGIVLWQFPPSLKKDVELLKDFLDVLPKIVKHTVEFRHKSWFCDEVFETLGEKGVALCIVDSSRIKSPWVVTSDFAYVRFHGPGRLYASEYGPERLKEMARRILELNADTFVYFNNDFEGYAIKDANLLKEFLYNLQGEEG